MASTNCRYGLTLIELIVCTLIIGILSTTAMPLSRNYVRHRKEEALRNNLKTLRKAIDRFYAKKLKASSNLDEKEYYPKSLQELIDTRCLRKIPVDPFSKEIDWKLISSTDPIGAEITDGYNVFDVRSSSELKSQNGTYYKNW